MTTSTFTMSILSLLVLVSADCNNSLIECSGHGNCVQANCTGNGTCTFECECDRNYITWPMTNHKSCNYKQTTWKDPFIAQLLFGYASGIGPFLIGNVHYGVIELLVTWLGWIPGLCFAGCLKYCGESGKEAWTLVGLWILVIALLWLIFLGLIAGRVLPDGQGAPLGHWD